MAQGLKGIPEVMRNLNVEIRKIKGRSMKGLILAVAEIRKDMDKTPPLIPMDTGNLRGSWFTTPFYHITTPGIMFGFSANYAWFVHEMVDKGKKINWNRPNSGPKFLEAALKRNEKKLLEIIAQESKKL